MDKNLAAAQDLRRHDKAAGNAGLKFASWRALPCAVGHGLYRGAQAVLLLLALHGGAGAAPQVLVAHPVVQGLAQELVRGSSIDVLCVTPPQLPAARHPAFLAGRGLDALQNAARQAEAVVTLRSIWPDDQLYPLARRSNIRIVEIDAAQPLEGDLPGLSLSAGSDALTTQPWLDGNNLARMASIIADALGRLYPSAAGVLHANLQVVQQRLRQLEINSTLALARLPAVSVLVLSPRVQMLALALKLEILACADESSSPQALQNCLQQEKIRLVLHHTLPDAALVQAIQAAGARLLVIPALSGNPVDALEKTVQAVLHAL